MRAQKRIMAMLLVIVMVLGLMPLSATAEGATPLGLSCANHTVHDETCGYVEAVAGQPCTHIHDEVCGYAEGTAEQPCTHQHDEACGYIEAVEAIPCAHTCELCAEPVSRTPFSVGDATLLKVAGLTITTGSEAGTDSAPKTASVTVPNAKEKIELADLVPNDTNATAKLYDDSVFSQNENADIALTDGSNTNLYIKVTAQDNTTILYYHITVTRVAGDVPVITPGALENAMVGIAYRSSAIMASEMIKGDKWKFVNSTLPLGIGFNSTSSGMTSNGNNIIGTFSAPGTYIFAVTVENASGKKSAPVEFSITVLADDRKTVGFGGEEWIVIGDESGGVASKAGALTLLRKTYAGSTQRSPFDSGNSHNEYSRSTLKTAMETAVSGLSGEEQGCILPRDLQGGGSNSDPDNIAGANVDDALFWPLSVSEASTLPAYNLVYSSSWWLRSPGTTFDFAAVVSDLGSVYAPGYPVDSDIAIRPAFHLNLASAIFTSAAAGGKSSVAVGNGASLSSGALAPANFYKFTMEDSAIAPSFSATTTGNSSNVLTLSYNNAAYLGGKTRTVSAIVRNSSGEATYYYKLLDITTSNAASGTVTIDLSDSGFNAADDTLHIFVEQHNGDNKTDFASTPQLVSLTPPAYPVNGTIGFGGEEWIVIGNESGGVAAQSDTLTLLRKTYAGDIQRSKFGNNNNYSGSTLQTGMNNAATALSGEEQDCILPRDFDGGATYDDGSDKVAGSVVTDANFWSLSVKEAKQLDSSVRVYGYYWWLRSPGINDYNAAVVNYYGSVDAPGLPVSSNYAIRPAFHLNLASAIFTSAASGGKSSGALAPAQIFKYTMADSAIAPSFSATTAGRSGDVLTIGYNNAAYASTETRTVSAIVRDSSGEATYYYKLKDITSSDESGTVTIDLNNASFDEASGDKLHIFVEQHNGDNYTDFASTPLAVSLTAATATAFSVQPSNASVTVGGNATFTATATGNPAPTYQWQESTNNGVSFSDITNGGIYSGATTNTLTLTSVQTTHSGYQYRCVATNSQNSATSNAATLTVNAASTSPTITGPTTMTLPVGYAATATSAYTITGNPAPTITKQSGDVAITWNDTTKQLDIAAGLAAGSYPVVLKASNSEGNGTLTFTLTVSAASTSPTITGPTTMTLPVGYAATATSAYTITGNTAPTITKQSGDVAITWNGTTKQLDIAAGLAAGSYPVVLKASNSEGDGTLTFTLTVSASAIAVTGVTVAPTKLNLTVGNSRTLIATVAPSSATNQAVTWSSSAPAIATVDASGKVTAVKAGSATITATTADGGKTATCAVTVSGGGSSVGGNNNDSGSGSSGNSSDTITNPISTEKLPNMPTLAKYSVWGTVKDKVLTVTITEKMAKDAIKAAQDAAQKSGKTADGIAVKFEADGSGAYESLVANLEPGAIEALITAGVKYVQIGSKVIDISYDAKALAQIKTQATGVVTVSSMKRYKLSDSAALAIGKRPAFDITVSSKKDGKGYNITNFGSGFVTIGIAYKPVGNDTGNLYAVYVKPNGQIEWLQNSSYAGSRLIFKRSTLSTYGVGYKAPTATFTDTGKHWAKDDIDFVVTRGLISGTSGTAFSPDKTITRAIFLTALGKLSGADVSSYKTSSFTDVPNTSPAMPYIEWAVKNNIVQGIGDNKFGPDQQITREQMAVMMAGYAKATGYKLPVSRTSVVFADEAIISAYAKDAVKALQQAGVMAGVGGNKFNPKGNATRAEASAILRRFVELIIDEGTARGWSQNDAGQWQYINANGKAVTGWQVISNNKYYFDANGVMKTGWHTENGKTYYLDANGIMVFGKWVQIGSKWYYLNLDGTLAVNTTVDGYTVGADGARKEK